MNKEILAKNLMSLLKYAGNSWILMSPNSIGEAYITCGFAKGFLDVHGGPVTLCLRPEHADIPKWFYPNRFYKVITAQMELMRAFSDFRLISASEFTKNHPINLSPIHYDGDRISRLHRLTSVRKGYGGLSITDVFRYMLRLDWNTPIEKPRNPCASAAAQAIAKKYAPGTYVFLFPGNNSNIPAPDLLWELLADKYLKMGLRVLVNSQGSWISANPSWPSGVEICQFGIVDAAILALQSHAVIGGNNGLMSLVSFFDPLGNLSPSFNVLVTDKLCIGVKHEGNKMIYDYIEVGHESFGLLSRELTFNKKCIYEWKIFSKSDNEKINEICDHITQEKKDSPHLISPLNVPEGAEPAPVEFDSKYIPKQS